MVNPQFTYTFSDRLYVTEIAADHPIYSARNPCFRASVAKLSKPVDESRGSKDLQMQIVNCG